MSEYVEIQLGAGPVYNPERAAAVLNDIELANARCRSLIDEPDVLDLVLLDPRIINLGATSFAAGPGRALAESLDFGDTSFIAKFRRSMEGMGENDCDLMVDAVMSLGPSNNFAPERSLRLRNALFDRLSGREQTALVPVLTRIAGRLEHHAHQSKLPEFHRSFSELPDSLQMLGQSFQPDYLRGLAMSLPAMYLRRIAIPALMYIAADFPITVAVFENWEVAGTSYEVDVTTPIGSGGYGTVYKATSAEHGVVAIKRIDYQTFDPAGDRELQTVRTLRNHTYTNVVALHAAENEEQYVYIVMELALRSLRADLDASPLVAEDEALSILTEIAMGLVQLHSHGNEGIVHRDLKPANVLVTASGYKLSDFGLSRDLSEATGRSTYLGRGTAEYKSPEQWQIKESTTATDLYALGCIAYELLSGATPFGADAQRHLSEAAAPIQGLSDPRIATLVRSLLNKDPTARPASAQAVVDRLQKIRDPQLAPSAVLDRIAQQRQLAIENRAKEQAKHEESLASARAAQTRAQDALIEIIDDVEQLVRASLSNVQRASSYSVTADGLKVVVELSSLQFNPRHANTEGHVELAGTLHIEAGGNARRDALNLAYICEDSRYLWKWYFFGDFAKPIPRLQNELHISPGTAEGASLNNWIYELELAHEGRGPGSHPLEVGYKITDGPLTQNRIIDAIEQVHESGR